MDDPESAPVAGEDQDAVNRLFEATFAELQRLAGSLMRQECPAHTLQPTALINEAYLRLCNTPPLAVRSRTHFVNIAAIVMRRILVEHARRRNAAKRGAGVRPVTLGEIGLAHFPPHLTFLDFEAALTRYARLDARAARVVELRVLSDLSMEEIAGILGVTRRTVQTDWRIATMWMRRELAEP